MLDSADMLYFFPHEFAGLRAGRLSLASVLAGTFNHFLFRHVSGSSLSGLSNRAVLVFLRSGLNARTGSSHGSFHSFDEAVKEKWRMISRMCGGAHSGPIGKRHAVPY